MGYPSGAMAHRPTLILASTSRYRRALLERLRVPFEVAAPPWSEVYLSDPDTTVSANALGKSRSVAAERPDAVILGSDQVAWCDGQIIEKPGTPEAACSQLALLAGREHALYTCVALRMPDGREREETVVANLRMRPLSSEQIAPVPTRSKGTESFSSIPYVARILPRSRDCPSSPPGICSKRRASTARLWRDGSRSDVHRGSKVELHGDPA